MAALIDHSDISPSGDFNIQNFNSKYQTISTAINSGVGTSLSYGGGVLSLLNSLGEEISTANLPTYDLADANNNGLLSSGDFSKLQGIESGAQVNTVTGIKGNSETNYRTGNVNITKSNIGLDKVDNTADSAKTVASAGTCTGTAANANKLNTDAGSATNPVYFSGGIPKACTYSLNKTVPSDAKFTDTTYSVATTSANGLMLAADKSKVDWSVYKQYEAKTLQIYQISKAGWDTTECYMSLYNSKKIMWLPETSSLDFTTSSHDGWAFGTIHYGDGYVSFKLTGGGSDSWSIRFKQAALLCDN